MHDVLQAIEVVISTWTLSNIKIPIKSFVFMVRHKILKEHFGSNRLNLIGANGKTFVQLIVIF